METPDTQMQERRRRKRLRERGRGRRRKKLGGGGGHCYSSVSLSRVEKAKDAKLQANRLPGVRYCSSNKVNNCFSLMHILVLLQAGSLPTAAAAVAVSVAHLAGRGARGGREFLTNDLHQYSHIPPKRARETGLSNYFARKTSSR